MTTWTISQLECQPQLGEYQTVAIVAHWQAQLASGEYTAQVYNTTHLLPPGDTFTPFAELTEAQAIAWVHEILGTDAVEATEAGLEQQIANQINPPVIIPPLPWATPAPLATI